MSKLKHMVQRLNGAGDLGRTTELCSRAQRISNHPFKPADGRSPDRHPHTTGVWPAGSTGAVSSRPAGRVN
jgi:hypothetical protein